MSILSDWGSGKAGCGGRVERTAKFGNGPDTNGVGLAPLRNGKFKGARYFTAKCTVRFFCQHAALCSIQSGRSFP